MRILTLLLALLATACTDDPIALKGVRVVDDLPVFATLADANDPIDMAAAPIVTRLALFTHNVAHALTHNRISRDQAITLRDIERKLRAEIEAAIAAKNIDALRAADAKIVRYLNELETYK